MAANTPNSAPENSTPADLANVENIKNVGVIAKIFGWAHLQLSKVENDNAVPHAANDNVVSHKTSAAPAPSHAEAAHDQESHDEPAHAAPESKKNPFHNEVKVIGDSSAKGKIGLTPELQAKLGVKTGEKVNVLRGGAKLGKRDEFIVEDVPADLLKNEKSTNIVTLAGGKKGGSINIVRTPLSEDKKAVVAQEEEDDDDEDELPKAA